MALLREEIALEVPISFAYRESSYLDIPLSRISGLMKRSRLKTVGRKRADGRRPLLVYLHPDVIKRLKVAALDEDRPAYELTEEAVSEWLAARNKKSKAQRR